MMPDVFYIFVVVVFVFLAGWFLFVTPKEIMFLLISVGVWGYALAQSPDFVAFAHEHWIAAILLWLGMSTVTWFGIMAAAVIGLGMGPTSGKSPVVETQQKPADWQKPGQEYKRRTGRDPVHCQSEKDWVEVMDA